MWALTWEFILVSALGCLTTLHHDLPRRAGVYGTSAGPAARGRRHKRDARRPTCGYRPARARRSSVSRARALDGRQWPRLSGGSRCPTTSASTAASARVVERLDSDLQVLPYPLRDTLVARAVKPPSGHGNETKTVEQERRDGETKGRRPRIPSDMLLSDPACQRRRRALPGRPLRRTSLAHVEHWRQYRADLLAEGVSGVAVAPPRIHSSARYFITVPRKQRRLHGVPGISEAVHDGLSLARQSHLRPRRKWTVPALKSTPSTNHPLPIQAAAWL